MCLLADYNSALEVLENVDFTQNEKPYYLRVTACYTSLYYYKSFASMMLRRYSDVIEDLTTFLSYIGNKTSISRTNQEDTVKKQIDHMHGLLAISLVLHPASQSSEETKVSDLYGDKMNRMQASDVTAFEEVFNECSPKFINTCVPDYDDDNYNQDAHKLQLKMFSNEVKQRAKHSEVYDYFKLSNTIGLGALCKLLECDEDTLSTYLLSMKHKVTNQSEASNDAPLNFYVNGDTVHVQESKSLEKHGEYFMRTILKYEDLIDDIKRISSS